MDYRGSDNLGAEFQRAVIGDAGDGPGKDVMAGVAALVARGFIDESRIGVSGWSYGGYMTSWLIGHYPETWKAALAGAAVTDYVESYALSDMNYAIAIDGQPIYASVPHTTAGRSVPWTPKGQAAWAEQSPISSVWRVKTPTLILSNTRDQRVPVVESYKLFRALRDLGVEAEFVAYHLDGHGHSDPYHERDVERRWLDWFTRKL